MGLGSFLKRLIARLTRSPVPQPQGLIRVLLDPTAEFGDRDDAALDLGAYAQPEAEAALLRVACDPSSDLQLVDTCGEALGEIWCRKGKLNLEAIQQLPDAARLTATAVIESQRPEWVAQLKK
mgnify:CR=1 FL=1